MESTQDGVEQIHAAEMAAREKIEEAEKRARDIRDQADRESKMIIQQAEESAKRESTRILEGISGEAKKLESKIHKDTDSKIEQMIAASEKKRKDAIKAAMKLLLEEE